MTSTKFTESIVEDAVLDWLENLGYTLAHGINIGPESHSRSAERTSFNQVVLEGRLRVALAQLNPDLPSGAVEDAFRKITRPEGPTFETHNHVFHRMLVNGVPVEYRRPADSIAGVQAQVIDFADPENNDWLVVNQYSVAENKHTRRPDVVLFINGRPLVIGLGMWECMSDQIEK